MSTHSKSEHHSAEDSAENSAATTSSSNFDPDDSLIQLLAEAEERVDQLRGELERRKDERLRHGTEYEQHAEIDRLAEHLENAQVNWHHVRQFFRSAIDECRTGRPWSGTSANAGHDQDERQ